MKVALCLSGQPRVVDIAFGGMDQRKAHMYMREVAESSR